MVPRIVIPPGSSRLRQSSPTAAAGNLDIALSARTEMLAGGDGFLTPGDRRHRQHAHHGSKRLPRIPRRRLRRRHDRRAPADGFAPVRALRHVHDMVRIDNDQFGTHVFVWLVSVSALSFKL